MMNSRVKPDLAGSDLESEDDYLGSVLSQGKTKFDAESDDDYSSLSFGALSSAQKKLMAEDGSGKSSKKNGKKSQKSKTSGKLDFSDSEESSDLELDGEDAFLQDSEQKKPRNKGKSTQQRRNKHAPAESSSKRPVSKIREIPGLKTPKDSTLYHDIRFDAAYGKADWDRIRKDYAFLDEYRQNEIREMQKTLKDKKIMLKLSHREAEDLKFEMQSLKSRLDTLKSRDLANNIVSGHKKEQMQKMRTGEQVNPYYLKKSEQRKMIQKAKFDSMRSNQREKVMERKRKRRLGKEFKQLEFRNQE